MQCHFVKAETCG